MTRISQLLVITHTKEEKVHTVSPGTSILEAARIARDKNIGALPVLYEGLLVGIITERDFTFKVVASGADPFSSTVADFMSPDPDYVTPFTDLMDCLNLMKEKKIRHVPVMDGKKLVGIVSMRDVLYVLLKNQELLAQQFESYIIGVR